jgi:hemerythrin-like domain-containing protein
MENERTPIKRSKQLAPLSREHHDGLLFGWKIKQGINNNTPTFKLRKFTMWFWQQYIKQHFFKEEKILLPHLPADDEMVVRLKTEHDDIRELILGLDDEADKQTLIILCDFLDKHIRFEEREFFPYIEKKLTTQQLNEVFEELEKVPHAYTEAWDDDEFWVAKK